MRTKFDGTIEEFNSLYRPPLAEWQAEYLSLLNSFQGRLTTMVDTVGTMSQKLDDLANATATEKAEVAAKLAELGTTAATLQTEIDALKAGAVTQEQLDSLSAKADEVKTGIEGIFTADAGGGGGGGGDPVDPVPANRRK